MPFRNFSLVLLRVVLGWMFFWAGITAVLNPQWSAVGYLQGAKAFTGIYHWFASPGLLPLVNFLNEWGLVLLGVSLILGIAVRLSSFFGIVLMLLYYGALGFPRPDAHSFVVDIHLISIAALLVLASFHAGRIFGLEKWCSELPICSRFPKLRWWIG